MIGIKYNGSKAALVIDGEYHYVFPKGTNVKKKIDQAEAIFCELPKPNGRIIEMNDREKQNLRSFDEGDTYDEM